MRLGLRGLHQRFAVSDAEGWRLQACMSPVWDTAWGVLALRAAGLPRTHPALRSAVAWMLDEQIHAGGDWQVKVPLRECEGWAFEFDNDIYPDIDDTAIVVLALLEAGEGPEARAAAERGARWAEAMRSSNGAWGSFDKDNTRPARLPHPLRRLRGHARPAQRGRHRARARDARRARPRDRRPGGPRRAPLPRPRAARLGLLVRTLGRQPPLRDLVRDLGARPRSGCGGPHLPRAVGWLLQVQNRDGGWGETCHSYEDESFAGVGVSTASQTAWAVMALQRSGHGEHSACRRGLAFLRDRQQAGTWPEPEYTGTGFPGDFYLNYGMYRHLFPTMALAMDGGLGASGELRGARVERRPADQPAADQLLERNASPSNVVEVAGRTAAGPPSESPASHPDRED